MKRASNYELLRIIAILLVVFSHIAGHGVMMITSAEPYVRWAEGPVMNCIFASLLIPGGEAGIGVFFIISGYFMISSTQYRSLLPLLKQTLFYAFVSCLIIIVIQFLGIYAFSPSSLISSLFLPISSNSWWFVSVYFLICMSSQYINHFFKQLDKKSSVCVLIAGFLLWVVLAYYINAPYYSFVKGVWYYLLGGFISKYKVSWNRSVSILVLAVSWLTYSSLMYCFALVVSDSIEINSILSVLILLNKIIPGPVIALSLFMLFSSIKITENNRINWLASCSLGLYLFHDSQAARYLLWRCVFNVSGPIYDSIWFPLFCVFAVICVAAIVIILETIRKRLDAYLCDRFIHKNN